MCVHHAESGDETLEALADDDRAVEADRDVEVPEIGRTPDALERETCLDQPGLAVAVASREFAALADQMARELRFPDARVVVVPHPIGGTPEATLDAWAEAALDDLERQLR